MTPEMLLHTSSEKGNRPWNIHGQNKLGLKVNTLGQISPSHAVLHKHMLTSKHQISACVTHPCNTLEHSGFILFSFFLQVLEFSRKKIQDFPGGVGTLNTRALCTYTQSLGRSLTDKLQSTHVLVKGRNSVY